MKLLLLSGGSGKRLWPLSNDLRPKQYLELLKNKKNQLESMVKRVWNQLASLQLTNECYYVTCKSQLDIMKSQLGEDVPVIIEPEQRDTFPAIALAVSYLYSIKGVDLEEVVCVLPVDHYVEEHFFHTVNRLERIIKNTQCDIALIGVSPTQPSVKYGYILPQGKADSENKGDYYFVERFIEKPKMEQAQSLINLGAFWNCGVFAFKVGYILSLLARKNYPLNYNELKLKYHELPKISFDYEVLENARGVAVAPYKGSWKDLGTWNSLTEKLDNCLIGEGFISEDSINTHVINELMVPVKVFGITDAVVAASNNGILVTDKKASVRMKDIHQPIQQPSMEEIDWGSCRILDYVKYPNGFEVLTKKMKIFLGKSIGSKNNKNRTKIWTIIAGDGKLIKDGITSIVKKGDHITIAEETEHELIAISPIDLIEIQIDKIL